MSWFFVCVWPHLSIFYLFISPCIIILKAHWVYICMKRAIQTKLSWVDCFQSQIWHCLVFREMQQKPVLFWELLRWTIRSERFSLVCAPDVKDLFLHKSFFFLHFVFLSQQVWLALTPCSFALVWISRWHVGANRLSLLRCVLGGSRKQRSWTALWLVRTGMMENLANINRERSRQSKRTHPSLVFSRRRGISGGLILASAVGYYRLLMLRCIQPAVEAGSIQKQPALCAASVGRGQIEFPLWTNSTSTVPSQPIHPSLGPPTQNHLVKWGKRASSGQLNSRRQLFWLLPL